MQIKNQSVIITGGGSGLGAATATLLSQLGAKVALFDTDVSKTEQLATKIQALSLAVDVTQSNSVEEAIQKVESAHGIARILINCAGIATPKRILGKNGVMPLADFEQIVNVNLIGTFNVMRLVAARMQTLAPLEDAERGLIINTASIAAYEGQIGQTAYSASKGGIVSMTLPAARELASIGIRVMAIAPGIIDTPMLQALPENARTALSAAVPFPKRLGKAEEFARLVQHIIENVMLNGSVIRLDGALRMNA